MSLSFISINNFFMFFVLNIHFFKALFKKCLCISHLISTWNYRRKMKQKIKYIHLIILLSRVPFIDIMYITIFLVQCIELSINNRDFFLNNYLRTHIESLKEQIFRKRLRLVWKYIVIIMFSYQIVWFSLAFL